MKVILSILAILLGLVGLLMSACGLFLTASGVQGAPIAIMILAVGAVLLWASVAIWKSQRPAKAPPPPR